MNIIYKDESYRNIGACVDVHNNLGPGFSEIVYKDALEYEFQERSIPYKREKKYLVHYKGIIFLCNATTSDHYAGFKISE